jgi:hypothetical protein
MNLTRRSDGQRLRQALGTLALAAALAACSGPKPPAPDDAELARQALVGFFADLHAGRYAQAAEAYAGTYETMTDHNPGLDPADHAALFRNACTINGAQCLEVRSAELLPTVAAQQFRFGVEFQLEDGSVFVQGPCCGGSMTDYSPLSTFTYTVSKGKDGRFRILDMPVYMP